MKHMPIHSKWHKIADLSKIAVALQVDDFHGFDLEPNTAKYIKKDVLKNLFDLLDRLPKYVMYDDIVRMVYMDNSPFHSTVLAMEKAKLCHLPFGEILVEYDAMKQVIGNIDGKQTPPKPTKVREFVWLGEHQPGATPEKIFDANPDFPFFAMSMTLVENHSSRPFLVLGTNALMCRFISPDGKLLGFEHKSYLAPHINADEIPKDARQKLMLANRGNTSATTICALTAVIALLKTRGIMQQHVEAPAKLNKSRLGSGKHPIPSHTVVRIGHVYDRAGNATEYKSTGRVMPVHWRAGHIRNQKYGPGFSKTREIFIEPMLVNYVDDNESVPVPTKEITI